MQAALLVLQVLLAVSLIALVLVQHGKGADAGAAFGSGASATVFGAQGSANFLTRVTATLATLFFLTSMTLAYLYSSPQERGSVTEQAPPAQERKQEKDGPSESAPGTDVPTVPGTGGGGQSGQ